MLQVHSYPSKANTGDGTAQHVSHDGRVGVGSGEVGVEARGVPVGDSGHDNSLQVAHDSCPVLRLFRGLCWHQRPQVTRLYRWDHLSGIRQQLICDIGFAA